LELRDLFTPGDRHTLKLLAHGKRITHKVISLLEREETVREDPRHIEYVSYSSDALYEEGKAMHNCVAGYAKRVAAGECFIYHVLRPERCTLSIALGPDMRFHISELRGPCNRPLSFPSQTRRLIESTCINLIRPC
jgi:hypothetical protein